MKNFLWIVFIIFFVSLSACYRVNPGNKGIMVHLTGSKQGEMEMKTPGRYSKGINKSWYSFPTYKQNWVWTQNKNEGSETDESFNFPVDGMVVGLDVGIEYSLRDDKIKDIFESYRKGVDELTDITIRNAVRDSINRNASEYSMNSLIEAGVDPLLTAVFNEISATFEKTGIIIYSLSAVSAPRYPQKVIDSIEAKIEATQRAVQAENELRVEKAEAAKKEAEAKGDAAVIIEIATANAEANRLRSASLTPSIIRKAWIDKWDGHLSYVSGDTPMIIQLD